VKAESIISAVLDVTKEWAKTRKAEERDQSRIWRRRELLTRPRRETIKDVAWEIMPAAYAKASGGGRLPAHARQIMYAARGEIQRRTGRTLDDQYFCQTLLPDYIDEQTEATGWDVVFDARGHFAEPHTKVIVPLGTLDVRGYLNDVEDHTVGDPELVGGQDGRRYPTCGPQHRFSAVLFIEKEGFLPLFERVQLAERYDLAIMSTKGLSVTASRQLVDKLCGGGDPPVPLLVLHDFDKAGFSILGTLQRDTRRYMFENDVPVIDLGLRLVDVQAHQLEPESVSYGTSDPTWNLSENGATAEEIRFLCSTRDARGFSGRRVELNAFASDQLITWIEAKLMEQNVRKVIPDDETLEAAYRRAVQVEFLRTRLEELANEATEAATTAAIPSRLRERIRERFGGDLTVPWDQVVADLARDAVEER
jgi:hypothetical protein